jgi:hypothetical protein
MLDFTKRSAQRFKLQWNDLSERRGDHWKVEVEMFGGVLMPLIVHDEVARIGIAANRINGWGSQ